MSSIEINGKPIRDGQTVSVDHSVKTFTLTIRSMNNVDVAGLKEYLERKFEVVDLQKVEDTTFVRASRG